LIVSAQVNGLTANTNQTRMSGQVQLRKGGLWVYQLAQAEFDTIGMGTVEGQRLLYSLLDQLGRMTAMQIEDSDELTDPAAIGPRCLQMLQQLLVDERPARTPLADRFGIL
jgi:hypothetical protein